jgi:acetyl esterase/lipase
MQIERSDEIGFQVYTVKLRKGDSGRRIVYIHGGSYVNTIAKQHWTFITKLAERLGAGVIVPDYLLAPEHTWRESFPGMVDLARCAADDARPGCTLIGDSSGGGYTLAVAQQLSAAGIAPLPLVLISPFVDLTLTDPRSRAIDPADPWHSIEGLREAGRLWAGGDDLKRPEVSPLFGNFVGLGPLLVFSSTRDVLNPQSHDLVEKARSDGVSVEFIEEIGLIHAYPLLPIPEAQSAMDCIIDFVTHR